MLLFCFSFCNNKLLCMVGLFLKNTYHTVNKREEDIKDKIFSSYCEYFKTV